MDSGAQLRHNRTSSAFVLMLAAGLIVFAIWAKVQPSLDVHGSASGSPVKLWVDPVRDDNAQLKLAPISFFGHALVAFLPAILPPSQETSTPLVMTPELPARNAFVESRYWFRPPPRS
jgi:hypothetical protein